MDFIRFVVLAPMVFAVSCASLGEEGTATGAKIAMDAMEFKGRSLRFTFPPDRDPEQVVMLSVPKLHGFCVRKQESPDYSVPELRRLDGINVGIRSNFYDSCAEPQMILEIYAYQPVWLTAKEWRDDHLDNGTSQLATTLTEKVRTAFDAMEERQQTHRWFCNRANDSRIDAMLPQDGEAMKPRLSSMIRRDLSEKDVVVALELNREIELSSNELKLALAETLRRERTLRVTDVE